MNTIKSLITLSLIFGCLAATQTLEGGHLSQILQGTAFIGVFGLMVFASIHHLGVKATIAGILESLLGSPLIKADDEDVRSFHDLAPTWAMFGANIVSVLGLIHVMSMLNDPSKIGEGVAVAFVSYIYGGLGVLLFGSKSHGARIAKVTPAAAMVPALGCGFIFMTIMYAISVHP